MARPRGRRNKSTVNEQGRLLRNRVLSALKGTRWSPEDCQDIAQQVLIDWSKCKFWDPKGKKLYYVIVDAIRTLYGRPIKDQGNVGSWFALSRNCWPLELEHNEIPGNEPSPEILAIVKADVDNIVNKHDRMLLLLRHRWGFEAHEIGYMFGVDSRTAQEMLERAEKTPHHVKAKLRLRKLRQKGPKPS